jgi:hypothetical protein
VKTPLNGKRRAGAALVTVSTTAPPRTTHRAVARCGPVTAAAALNEASGPAPGDAGVTVTTLALGASTVTTLVAVATLPPAVVIRSPTGNVPTDGNVCTTSGVRRIVESVPSPHAHATRVIVSGAVDAAAENPMACSTTTVSSATVIAACRGPGFTYDARGVAGGSGPCVPHAPTPIAISMALSRGLRMATSACHRTRPRTPPPRPRTGGRGPRWGNREGGAGRRVA